MHTCTLHSKAAQRIKKQHHSALHVLGWFPPSPRLYYFPKYIYQQRPSTNLYQESVETCYCVSHAVAFTGQLIQHFAFTACDTKRLYNNAVLLPLVITPPVTSLISVPRKTPRPSRTFASPYTRPCLHRISTITVEFGVSEHQIFEQVIGNFSPPKAFEVIEAGASARPPSPSKY